MFVFCFVIFGISISTLFSQTVSLFKKDEKLYTITKAILDDKKIICYYDLYTKIGIAVDIEEMIKQNEFRKYHYQNIQANYKTIRKLDELIRFNLVNSKNKYTRMYNKQYLASMAAMDGLQWSPKVNNSLEDDVIRVILPNNKEFVNVTEKDL